MSLAVMTWVWGECDVTNHTELLVLLALADEADDDGGNCHPSLRRIASKSRLSVGGAHKAIARLEDGGYITVDRPETPAEGRHNRYRILIPQGCSPGERTVHGEDGTVHDRSPQEVNVPTDPDQRSNPGAPGGLFDLDTVDWQPPAGAVHRAKAPPWSLTDDELDECVAAVNLEGLTGRAARRRFGDLVRYAVQDRAKRNGHQPVIDEPTGPVCSEFECQAELTPEMAGSCVIGFDADRCPHLRGETNVEAAAS